MNGKLSSEAGCPWPQYLLEAKVSCGLWVVFVSAGGAIQGALCLDSVVATSSGPDIGHGEPPASASSVKVNVATCITACEYTLFYQSLCFFFSIFQIGNKISQFSNLIN